MTDFSFQNKAYDLLLSLREEKSIKPKITINTIKDLRLMMDIVRDTYPIYANADNITIADFVKDIFNVDMNSTQINIANQELDEIYRPVECWEIKPGVRLKIVESNTIWYRTFWTYSDTNKIIPLEETTPERYSRAYMYIWEKAEKGNVFIKNTFLYKKGDTISHKYDRNTIGIIKERLPANRPLPLTNKYEFYPNQYAICWKNKGLNPEVPLKYWYDERELIKIKPLEALPMKTKNERQRITYKKYSPEEWLKQEITKGYDEAVYRTLLQRNQTHGIDPDKEHGWITVTKKAPFRRKNNAKSSIQKKNERIKRREKRIYPFKDTPKPKDKLKRVKFITTGEIVSMKESKANQLVTRDSGKFIYVSKTEWREYKLNKKDKPKFCLPEGKDIRGHNYDRGTRRIRRHIDDLIPFKDKKTSDVYSQMVHQRYKKVSEDDRKERSMLDRERYLRKKGKKSLDDLKHEFASDERRNEKFSPSEKWSRSFIALYKVVTTNISEVAKGIFVSLPKKGVKVVANTILKYEHKLTWSENKINDFIRYLRLTTHGVFTGPKTTKPKKVKQVVEHEPINFITRINYSKLRYDENKKVIVESAKEAITEVPIKYRRKKNES